MHTSAHTLRSEQGAVFVQVGISLFVLMAFNVFVLDYGVMWASRRQAQNAADAGALAGAVARGYDDFADPPASDGAAARIAMGVATAPSNWIWREAGVPEVSFDCPAGTTGRCTRVNVYRNADHANEIDTLFGPILGITGQGVRATATAITASGNATPCLRPIAFADAWSDAAPPSTEFNRYDETTGAPLGTQDVYTPPSATQAGQTTIPDDVGERIVYELDMQTITRPFAPITRELLVALTFTNPDYKMNIVNCRGQVVQLGQTLPVQTAPPGYTEHAFDILIGLDSGARWNEALHRIENSCAPGCAPISPRLIPVALFDPARFQLGRATNDWTQAGVGCPTNSPCITVTNIVGFFVHGSFAGYGPHGHFLRYPGESVTTAPTFVDEASWLVMTHLIR
jgi:Flp pilus assembly protein TadG